MTWLGHPTPIPSLWLPGLTWTLPILTCLLPGRYGPLLPEVHTYGDTGPDLSGSEDAQCLCENDMGKGKGYLRVTSPVDNPPPFRLQD